MGLGLPGPSRARTTRNCAFHSAGTARKGPFLFPTRSVGETRKKLTKGLGQTLRLRLLPCVMALLLQGFLNLLAMDNFQAGVRKRMHVLLPSFLPNGMVRIVGCQRSSLSLIADALSIDDERW